jgi:RNA polymerase sigma-70 factor (ECF subfamily)
MLNETYNPRPNSNCASPETHSLERLRSGDHEAYRQIITDLQPALLRRAKGIVSDHPLAEDVVQETWLAVVRGIFRFEGRSSLKTWIFSILDHRARSMVRKERRSTCLDFEDLYGFQPQSARSVESPDSRLGESVTTLQTQGDQEAEIISKEQLRVMRQAMAALPIRQRRVFELRVLRGESAKCVSLKLRITEGNQRVLLHRARRSVSVAIADRASCPRQLLIESQRVRSPEGSKSACISYAP